MTYTVGIIGTGVAPGGTEESGMAMGYRHAEAYAALEHCDIVAGADAVGEHAERFAEHFGLDAEAAFQDHRDMLAELDLDVVSIATPVPTHADIVFDCLRVGTSTRSTARSPWPTPGGSAGCWPSRPGAGTSSSRSTTSSASPSRWYARSN